MFLFSGPAIWTNYQGGGITESSNFLLETTLGNTKKYIKGSTETAAVFSARKKSGLGDVAYWTIISDLAYSFSFFLFIIFWRWKSGQILAQYNEQKRDTSHYAVMLKGFPKNQVLDDKELYDFFAKLEIRVHECVFARRYQGTLYYYQKIAEHNQKILYLKLLQERNSNTSFTTQKKIDFHEKKVWSLRKKLLRIHAKNLNHTNPRQQVLDSSFLNQSTTPAQPNQLANNSSTNNRPGLTVLRAYVIFESVSAPYQTRRRFTKEYSKYLCGCLWCSTRSPAYYFLNKHRLTFHPPDNPYNIKWENLEQGKCKHFTKQLLVCWLFTLMAIICFVLVFTINQATADIVVRDCPENVILIGELGLNGKIFSEHAFVFFCHHRLCPYVIFVSLICSCYCV